MPMQTDMYELGEKQKTYTFSSLRFVFSALILLAYGLLMSFAVIGLINSPEAPFVLLLPDIFGGIVYTILVIITIQALRTVGTKVEIYEKGFVLSKRGTTQVFQWDDIETVWAHIHCIQIDMILIWLGFKMRVRTVDGREGFIPRQLKAVDEIAEAVILNTNERLMEQVFKQLDKGEIVRFGDHVQLSKNELMFAGREIPWNRVGSVYLFQSSLSVTAQDDVKLFWRNQFVTTPMYQVPNLFVRLAIAKHFVSDSRALNPM